MWEDRRGDRSGSGEVAVCRGMALVDGCCERRLVRLSCGVVLVVAYRGLASMGGVGVVSGVACEGSSWLCSACAALWRGRLWALVVAGGRLWSRGVGFGSDLVCGGVRSCELRLCMHWALPRVSSVVPRCVGGGSVRCRLLRGAWTSLVKACASRSSPPFCLAPNHGDRHYSGSREPDLMPPLRGQPPPPLHVLLL